MTAAPRSSTIGIVGSYIPVRLKQMALLFDQIAIDNLRVFRDSRSHEDIPMRYKELGDELEFLENNGIVFQPKRLLEGIHEWGDSASRDEVVDLFTYMVAYENRQKTYFSLRNFLNTSEQNTSEPRKLDETSPSVTQFFSELTSETQFHARALAKKMQRMDHLDAVPVFDMPMIIPKGMQHEYRTIPATIAEVVLDRIPMPSDSTPWEQIIEFRDASENRGYLKGLRTWMNKLVQEKRNAKEVEDELDWLIFQQQQHLKNHRIDFWQGAMGAAFVASAEFVEDLAKLKFGKIAHGIVSVVDRKATLLRTELESPAKEINYILRARREFGN